ncbi:MAG TPA: MaoC family dehydratase [Hyphomicrobiaceae bacterium]|nr:MaoC family dehydratase [Hyphomicrobiaceae bacterium]
MTAMDREIVSESERVHLEDIEVGRTLPFGKLSVSKEDIVAFARAFDPQPIHLDEEAAKRSIVGGLCASGFHSCALQMRLLADGLLNRWTSLGSPGIDEVKWSKPVRPGDMLTGRYTCTEKRALGSRPEVGLAKITMEMLNGSGDVVQTWFSNQLVKVRDPKPVERAPEGAGSGTSARLESLWDGPPRPEPSRTSNYFEDRVIGETFDLGSQTLTREEVIAFAREFDPQPFHLDDAAAAKTYFGRLSASGWHTAALFIRQFVAFRQKIEGEMRDKGLKVAHYGPSPGFRNLRWLKPVYPGDTLTFRGRTAGKIDLKSRPDRGLIQTDSQARNQHGEIVFAIRGQILAERRETYRPS